MAERPVRLQLSRRKGFNLQALSQAINGLPAVKVTRPGKRGNPFVIGELAPRCYEHFHRGEIENASQAVALFRRALTYEMARAVPSSDRVIDLVADLHGKNLACWCRLDQPCHADVLIEIANR